jgi:hypothetical protein
VVEKLWVANAVSAVSITAAIWRSLWVSIPPIATRLIVEVGFTCLVEFGMLAMSLAPVCSD